jgi:uncharacterized membrane protein YdbT with pleckstrin-like domain
MIEKIKNLLSPNERILKDARIHWIVFVAPVSYLVIALLAGVFFHPIMGFVILMLSLYPSYTAIIHYWMTHLILTNKKVMSRIGFLTRDWTQMRIEKIENAYLEEPIVGRFLGYSTVVVSGMGSGAVAVPYVIDGYGFVKDLEKLLEKQAVSA